MPFSDFLFDFYLYFPYLNWEKGDFTYLQGDVATGRAHADAREGCHVACKDGRWRAHGYSGPW